MKNDYIKIKPKQADSKSLLKVTNLNTNKHTIIDISTLAKNLNYSKYSIIGNTQANITYQIDTDAMNVKFLNQDIALVYDKKKQKYYSFFIYEMFEKVFGCYQKGLGYVEKNYRFSCSCEDDLYAKSILKEIKKTCKILTSHNVIETSHNNITFLIFIDIECIVIIDNYILYQINSIIPILHYFGIFENELHGMYLQEIDFRLSHIAEIMKHLKLNKKLTYSFVKNVVNYPINNDRLSSRKNEILTQSIFKLYDLMYRNNWNSFKAMNTAALKYATKELGFMNDIYLEILERNPINAYIGSEYPIESI